MRRGRCSRGTFTRADAGLTTAAHMGGEPVRVTARFSNGGGDPAIPDYAREGRGLAVKFYLPDGSQDGHRGAQPALLLRPHARGLPRVHARAQAGPRDRPARLREGRRLDGGAPRGRPVDPGGGLRRAARELRDGAYNSIHSFRWTRRTAPSAGCATASSPRRASGRSRRGREGASGGTISRRRSSRGTSTAFRMVVVIAARGRRGGRPHRRVALGARAGRGGPPGADRPETEREQGDDILVFDPTRVTDGIELSDDPILTSAPARTRPR